MASKHIFLALIFVAGVLPAKAATLFLDGFENPPDVSGNNPLNWTVSNSQIVVTNQFAAQGSQSLFIRDGGPRLVTQTSAIAITEFEDLVFSFEYGVTSSTESGEGLIAFNIDFGNGFETVINDEGAPDGTDSVYSGTTITLANTAGGTANAFVAYTVTIPTSYYVDVLGATDFRLQFITDSSAGSENFRLDTVSAATVPEPSTVSLGAAAALLMALKRRPKLLARSS